MRLALLGVGFQHRRRSVAAQHQRQLPGEIDGIADAGRQALSEKRRRLMHGVAHQQDAARLPALRKQRVKAVHRRAPDFELRRIGEGGQNFEHVIAFAEGRRIFAGQNLDLPAPQRAGAWQERAGSRRPAILKTFCWPLGCGVVESIDHHPPFVEGEVVEADIELLAHEAVGAVAGDQIARTQHAFAAVAFDRQRDAGVVLRHVDGLRRQKYIRLVIGRELPAQRGLEFRLHEGRGRRPAERVGRRHRIEHLDHLAVDAEIVRARMRHGMRGDGVLQPASLEHAQYFVVDGNGARLVVDAGRLLDDDDVQAIFGQQIGKCRPDRPIADNGNVIKSSVRHHSIRQGARARGRGALCAPVRRCARNAL